jgi:hypothetical protein
MAITTPLAYNPSLSPIDGTDQVGTLAVGITDQDYSIEPGGVTWWMGPDEENGYVISIPVSGNTQPTPISGVTASVGFYQSTGLTDISFVQLTNNQFNQNFSSATDASIWLTNNGYWNSYPAPVLYLDAGNTASYPGTGTVWTDLVGGKVFNLINGPSYDPESSDSIYFNAASNQYANCSTSLPSLPIFTTTVWHYWDGTNSGGLPCILTEVYTGSINYFVGAPQGVVAQGGYFNGGFQVSPQFGLTANTWYNIVVTCDSSQIVKIYINGTLISSTATSGPQPSSSNAGINLMRRWDNAEYWGGYLSTVGIYNKALTPGQISGIYNATKSRYGYGPSPTPTPTETSVAPTPTPTGTPVSVTPTPTPTTPPTLYSVSISTVYGDDIGACGGNANITAYSTNNGYPQLGDIYYTTGAGTTTYGAGWYLNGDYYSAIELDTSGALINGPNSC